MLNRILRIILVCVMIGPIFSSLPSQQSLAATADDYFIYSRFDPPGVGDITAAGGYVKYTGIPDVWGDEIQYVYFLSGNTGYKVKVWVTDGDGDGKIDPRQHPDHYLSGYVGPIEPRHFEIVSSADLTGYTGGSSSHTEEFYIDSSGVYLGAYPNGIHKWDHNWNYLGKIANPPPARTESMAYNPSDGVWYAGGRYRNIYELRDVDNDGSFLDETWSVIFSYPSYSGDHHDGMEYVAGYLWISDMTSDVIGKWEYDSASASWIEVERFTYTEPGHVEGMGFGPNDHFWVASGPYSDAYIYELGNEITRGYPVAEAGSDVGNHAPTVPITLNGSGSHHTDPSKQIVLYEWDFEGAGIWDYTGTDPIVEHTYPAYYNPDGSIDWDETAKDYAATLRVTDNSDPPLQDTDTCIVHITAPPWKPVADPDGPYEGAEGAPVELDGSASYDPESKMVAPGHPWYETIAKYEWDLDYDGEFDDSTDVKPSWTWESEGIYIVSLRVTDSQPSGPGGTVGPLDVDVEHATVVITEQKPPTTKIETHVIDSANGTAKFTWSGSDDSTPPAQLVYKHRLLNPDSPLYDWSDWSSSTTATYPRAPDTRLPDGTYRFQVKAKDADEAIQPDSATYKFTIGAGAPGTINGRVTDASIPGPSNGIAGAVLLLDPDPFTYCPTTLDQGYFSFSIPAGTYNITASASGYSTLTKSVTVIAGEPTEVNFALTKQERVPVIIIPGVMGSYLKKGNDVKWDPDRFLENIKEILTDLCLGNPACEVTAYDIAHGAYDQLVWKELPGHGHHNPFAIPYPFEKSAFESLSKDNDLFLFPYDWRQDLKKVVNDNLKPAIEEILTRTGSEKVDIVAHSMGGLISRYYVNKAGGGDKIRHLILVGVPHFGSLAAYAPLHPELGCFRITPTTSICVPGVVSPFANAFESSYELLPMPQFFRLYDYFFIDEFPFGKPGKLDGNGNPVQAFRDTYIENSDSKVPNQNYLTTGLNFHNQIGNEINTAGSVFVLTEWKIPTVRSLTKTWKPLWLPGATAITYWSADFAPGDGRVLAKVGAGLKPSGDTKLYNYFLFTSVAHGGLLNDGHIATVVRSILEGQTWDPEWTKWGIYKEQSAHSFSYSRFEMQSNASFDLYDSEGRHTGFIADGIIETSPVTQYLALGDSTIAAVPSDDEYRVEIIPGQSCCSPSQVRHPLAEEEACFTFIITKFEEEAAIVQYIFDDIPISLTWKGTIQYDPDSAEVPTIQVDSDGDGSVDRSIPAKHGNTPLGSSATLSFYDGLVTLVFGEITSAGHTVCQSVETLEGVDPAPRVVTPFYWLSTSALFSGSASVTIQYDEDDVPTGRESDLKLYRITSEDAVEDITQQLDQAANTVTGQTDAFSYFVVGYMSASPETSILSPSAGDTVTGQSCNIQWQTTDPDTPTSSLSIDLFYSTNGGSTWTSISSNVENDGSYDWNTSALLGGEYWLKIVATDPEEGTSEETVGPFTVVTLVDNVIIGPNPVGSVGTAFFYTLPEGTSAAKLMIFGVIGQLLFETPLDVDSARFPSAGTWNPVDQDGIPLANGPYVYVLIADGKVIGQGKMVIQR